MRLINSLIFIQIFVYAGLLQKFAPASSALEHDETHTSDYDIDEMVKWSASSRCSFRPNAARGSMETKYHREDAPHFKVFWKISKSHLKFC